MTPLCCAFPIKASNSNNSKSNVFNLCSIIFGWDKCKWLQKWGRSEGMPLPFPTTSTPVQHVIQKWEKHFHWSFDKKFPFSKGPKYHLNRANNYFLRYTGVFSETCFHQIYFLYFPNSLFTQSHLANLEPFFWAEIHELLRCSLQKHNFKLFESHKVLRHNTEKAMASSPSLNLGKKVRNALFCMKTQAAQQN